MGTAGSLIKLKKILTKPFFVTNCDILVEGNYVDMYEHHLREKNDITIIASTNEFKYPYGVCKLDNNGKLIKINEKPRFNFLVNTGLYIINPKVLNFFQVNKYLDMDELIQKSLKNKKRISIYPIHQDHWLDIGNWNEYSKKL